MMKHAILLAAVIALMTPNWSVALETSGGAAAAVSIDDQRDQARALYKDKNYRSALEAYERILVAAPGDKDATKYAERCRGGILKNREKAEAAAMKMREREIDELFSLAQKDLKAGRYLEAEARLQRILELDPKHKRAGIYLEESRELFDKGRADLAREQERTSASGNFERALNQRISIEVEEPTPLSEFLSSLSLYGNFNYNIVAGGSTPVQGKFEDMRLRDVLDQTLSTRGLIWTPGPNMITISPNVELAVIKVSSADGLKIRSLMADGTLQRAVWGGDGRPPTVDVSLRYDERLGALVASDSRNNIMRIGSMIDDLDDVRPPTYETRLYKVRAEEGPKIKVLIESLLSLEETPSQSAGRKIILDGVDMIIRDTPENLQRVEVLLSDKGLLSGIASKQLEIGKWNLTPRDIVTQDSEALRAYFAGVVEVIETRLYSVEGKAAAVAQGRRLWADPSLLSLTITDTEKNIAAVGEYIDQLEILDRPQQSKIIFLKHADSSEIANQLREVLGLEPTSGGGGGADSVTRSLRQGDDFTWRDLRVRLVRVEDNDIDDENDDSAEFVLRTSTSDEEPTIEEFYTERISDANGEYEINVLDVDPSGNDDGEGRARIEIIYFEAAATP